MDFVRSYFFTNATLTSWPLFSFCHHFWVGATAKQKWWQNEKSGQLVRVPFVKKYVTSYKIHTLHSKIWKLATSHELTTLLENKRVRISDGFELEFFGLSEPELWRFRLERARAGALQFSSWNRAEIFLKV